PLFRRSTTVPRAPPYASSTICRAVRRLTAAASSRLEAGIHPQMPLPGLNSASVPPSLRKAPAAALARCEFARNYRGGFVSGVNDDGERAGSVHHASRGAYLLGEHPRANTPEYFSLRAPGR